MKINTLYPIRFIILSTVLILTNILPVNAQKKDHLFEILKEEVQREFNIFSQKQPLPLYFLSYRITDAVHTNISCSMGGVIQSTRKRERELTLMTRIGDYSFDNYRSEQGGQNRAVRINLPLEDSVKVIQRAISDITNQMYNVSLQDYNHKKANAATGKTDEKKIADYSKQSPVEYSEPFLSDETIYFETKPWEDKLKSFSAIFRETPEIVGGWAFLSVSPVRRYYASSENVYIVQNDMSIHLSFSATMKDKDGNDVTHTKYWNVTDLDNLPTDTEITNTINQLIVQIKELKEAPYADAYTGPVLLSGVASAVFFHEIFGHRVEGHRLKDKSDAHTFKDKIGELVLDKAFSISMDPTIKEYKGKKLYGSYLYDDEGVKSQKVSLIEKGILKDFLMSRTPVEGYNKSNGHGRALSGSHPVARQSNLIAESSSLMSESELRNTFIEELKKQSKEYGYYFKEVAGGFTSIARYSPNAFNITPTIVYKVYTDGRPDELVRGVNLIGTPLSVFSNITQAGGEYEVFCGKCGAESGWLRVSSVSPMLLVKQVETQRAVIRNQKDHILPRP